MVLGLVKKSRNQILNDCSTRGKKEHNIMLGESLCIGGMKFLNSHLNPFDPGSYIHLLVLTYLYTYIYIVVIVNSGLN